MATKSDFAQKLLNDLRRRKEQIAVAENSGSINSGSRDAYGRSAQTHRGSGQSKALDSIGKKGGSSLQSSGRGNRSFGHEASSSNQIVLYGKGRIPEERGDLSMIFSLAFGNGSKVNISGNSALIKLLNQIETRPLDTKAKRGTDMSTRNQLSSSSFHITEISKGVEKLKQVIKAYPNGLDLNGRSTQAGRELLKGAMDLEQSLRMLVNLQEAADKKSSAQTKVKIRLLDEDEEDGDGSKAIIQADQKKQVDRPRFSFDKPSNKNSQGNKEPSANNYIKKHLMALTLPDETPKSDRKIETHISTSANMKAHHHKRAASVPDFRTHMLSETRNHPVSPLPKQEKGRISNVIAKLMGLEALPQKKNNTQKELSTKTKVELVSTPTLISAENNARDAESRRPTPIDKRMTEQNSVQPLGKDFRSALGTSIINPLAAPPVERMVSNERNKSHNLQAPARTYAAALIGRESMASTTERQPRHSIGPSVSGYCADSQGQASEAKGKHDKEKIRESKKLSLKTEPQNQVQQKNTTKNADNYESHGAKTRRKASETGTRSMCKIQPGMQQNPHSNRAMQKRPKEIEHQEDESQVQKRKQLLGRQKLLAGRHKISNVESAISSKTKTLCRSSRNTKPDLGQEAQKEGMFRGSLMPAKDLSHDRDHEKNAQQETLSNVAFTVIPAKDLSQHRDHEKNVQQETPSKISVIQRTRDDRNAFSGGTQDKFDSVVNGIGKENVVSSNDQSPVLHEFIKESHNKIYEERTELHKHHQHIESEVAYDHPKKTIDQQLNVKVTTEVKAMEFTELCSPEEAGQLQEISKTLPSKDKDLSIGAGVAFNDNCIEGQSAVSEYIELKQENALTDLQTETCVEEKNCNKFLDAQQRRTCPLGIEEQLTESEELLKQKLTKSRYFLNTAEALLKLNIPVRILIGDDDKVEDTETKLTLDCSDELLKWKGKKHDLRAHPYSCLSNNYMNRISSFRELIKQLCKDFDTLKLYGGTVDSESDVAAVLNTMIEKDIQHGLSDVSFMWDHGWGDLTSAFLEKDDIVKDVEKHMFNGLLNEITIDLLHFATTI